MKVVHLCSSGRVGGVETSVLTMLESLVRYEPSCHAGVIAPENATFLDGVRNLGLRAIAMPYPEPLATLGEADARHAGVRLVRAAAASVVYGRRLRRTLEQLAPDVVHAHGLKMQVLSRWAAPHGAAAVWHAHDYAASRPAGGRTLRHAATACRAAIANSHSVAHDFRAHVRSDVPISVIYNAVDLTAFTPCGAALDLDAWAGAAPPAGTVTRIGLAATFGRWKGHEVFLRALSRLTSEMNWRAYIIGGEVYQTRGSQVSLEQLRATAQQLGIAHRVVFTGLIHDMPSALRGLDIAVHASTQPEPFGMAIAEAMAAGRPVVAARAGGSAEIFTDGVDAVGYAPGDDAALAAALGALLPDQNRRAQLGARARRTAERTFDPSRLGPELLEVYRAARDFRNARLSPS